MVIPQSRPLFKPVSNHNKELLFYTYANQKYHEFGILYPLFALESNPNSIVEICVDNPNVFVDKYRDLILYYCETYPGRILFSYIPETNIVPHSIRFIVPPISKAKYIYIGDVDLLVLENSIVSQHIKLMEYLGLEYSNVKREGLNKLTGLHFMEYDKYYPIKIPSAINLEATNCEHLLYDLMLEKGYKVPTITDLKYRPVHGIHISLFSRPPLPTLTTGDRLANFPSWLSQSPDTIEHIARYLKIRRTDPILNFMSCICDENIELRRIIQFIDMYCIYCQQEYGDPCKNQFA